MDNIKNQFSGVCLIIALASIFLRLGYEDMLDSSFLIALGDSIIVHIPLLFGLLIAIRLDESKSYRSAIQVILFYLAMQYVLNYFGYKVSLLCGFLAGISFYIDLFIKEKWSKYYKEQWMYILFFALGGVCGVLIGTIHFSLEGALSSYAVWITELPKGLSTFLYGFSDTLLRPMGLNQEINFTILFQGGNDQGIIGDYYRNLQGGSMPGQYMVGRYPIVIFGFIGIMVAILYDKSNKKMVRDIISILLLFGSSILTGVTEGIDLLIIVIAPLLYIVHSLLTGISFWLCTLLECRQGYRFSAGILDYIFNYRNAINGDMIILLGIVFLLFYLIIFLCILNPILIKDMIGYIKGKIDLLLLNIKSKRSTKNDREESDEKKLQNNLMNDNE